SPRPGAPAKGSSLSRGLAVLHAVLDMERARADEIATRLSIPVSSVYRYLQTLRAHGLVDQRSHVYVPGPVFRHWTAPGLPREDLIRIADPVMRELTEATGETSVLSIRIGLHAV